MEIIRDGTGNCYTTKVDSTNRLYTSSESFVVEEIKAKDGNGFILHGECHTAAAASGGLLYFKNTSATYDVYITRIYIDPHTLTEDYTIQQIFDTTRTSGTDIGSTGKINKNRVSGNVLEGDLYISDASADMTFSGGTQYHSFPVSSRSTIQRNMNGTNVISPGKSIAFQWTATDGTGTDGEVISLSVNLYRTLIEE